MNALVVDDEPFLRSLMKTLLEKMQYTVVSAENGAEAFAVIQKYDFDLVISDINMPVMNGETLYHLIEERLPYMTERFVFCTGNTGCRETFLNLSGRPVLSKPFAAADFKVTVAAVADGLFNRRQKKQLSGGFLNDY